jgi:hypothetical protein
VGPLFLLTWSMRRQPITSSSPITALWPMSMKTTRSTLLAETSCFRRSIPFDRQAMSLNLHVVRTSGPRKFFGQHRVLPPSTDPRNAGAGAAARWLRVNSSVCRGRPVYLASRAPFDAVLFGFWISHVRDENFDQFWDLVESALKPGGQLFFLDDSHRTEAELIEGPESPIVQRELNDGQQFRVIKIPYEPAHLETRLRSMNWDIKVTGTSGPFYWGTGGRF